MIAYILPSFDKYAPYIWACFGIVVFALLAMLLLSMRKNARTRDELAALDGARAEKQSGGA